MQVAEVSSWNVQKGPVAHAGGVTGAGDVELWVRQKLGCREASMVVLATDHRRLLVRLAAPAFEIVVFVGHVLDALDQEALCDWWDVAERLLEKATARDVPFAMMVDANGR